VVVLFVVEGWGGVGVGGGGGVGEYFAVISKVFCRPPAPRILPNNVNLLLTRPWSALLCNARGVMGKKSAPLREPPRDD